jgi:hypothetical protein
MNKTPQAILLLAYNPDDLTGEKVPKLVKKFKNTQKKH